MFKICATFARTSRIYKPIYFTGKTSDSQIPLYQGNYLQQIFLRYTCSLCATPFVVGIIKLIVVLFGYHIQGKKRKQQFKMIALTMHFSLCLAHPDDGCVAPRLLSLILGKILFFWISSSTSSSFSSWLLLGPSWSFNKDLCFLKLLRIQKSLSVIIPHICSYDRLLFCMCFFSKAIQFLKLTKRRSILL